MKKLLLFVLVSCFIFPFQRIWAEEKKDGDLKENGDRQEDEESEERDGDGEEKRDLRAKARDIFQKGKELFAQKDYVGASAAFKQAYEIWQHRVVLYNLAVTYAFMGEHVQATVYARKFLKQAADDEKDLPRVLKDSMNSVGVLDLKVPDSEAALFVDGRLVGHGAAEVIVHPGTRVVDVRSGDRVLVRAEVRVEGGKYRAWELAEMDKAPDPEPMPEPKKKPLVEKKPSPPPPPPPVSSLKRVHWGAFSAVAALTVGSLIGAGALSLKTRNIHEEFEKDRTNTELADQGKKYQIGANILWGVTGAAALSAVILAVFTDWKGERKGKGSTVSYSIYPGGTSLRVSF